MSVLAIIVPIVGALIAMAVKAAILNRWVAQAMAADFCYALIILVAPLVLRA